MPIDQPPIAYTQSYSIQNTTPTFFQIMGGGTNSPEAMVTINLTDGSIKFGPNYKPDEAAQIFWQSIGSEYNDYLKWKVEHKP